MKRSLSLILLVATIAVATSAVAAPKPPRAVRTVALAVTANGFEPASVRFKAGEPVKLVVTRKVERTCATDIVIASLGIKKALPLNKPVAIRFTPKTPGTIRYACAMDMIAGSMIVE